MGAPKEGGGSIPPGYLHEEDNRPHEFCPRIMAISEVKRDACRLNTGSFMGHESNLYHLNQSLNPVGEREGQKNHTSVLDM